ncbi:DUF11 domain-containing protein [Actinomadura logoneensis]|uniref:DUF11 domain-containing protein n=1 Tax=Actinomadura logoneensis TaxID=2293572 RepID=UPI0013150204|nr:DUF11 domain-containing protein [Actinomadura logoneensis]
MRRAAGAALAGLAVAGAAAVATAPWSTLGSRTAHGPVDAAQAASHLRVSADRSARPVGADRLTPGGRYSYTFTVTNAGDRPVRGLVARSEPAAGEGAMRLVSVSDPSCHRYERVVCSFPPLDAGERRTVEVVATAAGSGHSGDVLRISTYLASFSTVARGSVSYDVLGRPVSTVTAFG